MVHGHGLFYEASCDAQGLGLSKYSDVMLEAVSISLHRGIELACRTTSCLAVGFILVPEKIVNGSCLLQGWDSLEVICAITEADLQALGIKPGHARKMIMYLPQGQTRP